MREKPHPYAVTGDDRQYLTKKLSDRRRDAHPGKSQLSAAHSQSLGDLQPTQTKKWDLRKQQPYRQHCPPRIKTRQSAPQLHHVDVAKQIPEARQRGGYLESKNRDLAFTQISYRRRRRFAAELRVLVS